MPSLLDVLPNSGPPLSAMTGQGIRIVKYYAWEVPFAERISSLRTQEVNKVRSTPAARLTQQRSVCLPVGMFVSLFSLGHSVYFSVVALIGRSDHRSACSLVGRFVRRSGDTCCRSVYSLICPSSIGAVCSSAFRSVYSSVFRSVCCWVRRSIDRSVGLSVFCPATFERGHLLIGTA